MAVLWVTFRPAPRTATPTNAAPTTVYITTRPNTAPNMQVKPDAVRKMDGWINTRQAQIIENVLIIMQSRPHKKQ